MLANGMGGIDWAGLDYAATYLGVTDLDMLTERLMVIKLHRPDKPADTPPPEADPPNLY